MAKRCPESGEIKLYLNCLECENKHWCRDATKRSEAKETERIREENEQRESQEVEQGYFEMDVTVKQYPRGITSRQENFINSLLSQTKRKGCRFLFPDQMQLCTLSCTEASLLIEILLAINDRQPRKDTVVFHMENILAEIRRIEDCKDGSWQKIQLQFSVQGLEADPVPSFVG